MTIDPLTFILEIVNFLVLLWLLHRFLYRPIQRAIADRRQALNRELTMAKQREQAADALQQQYQQQLADWETEKARQEDDLHQSLAKEQENGLAKARAAVEAERIRLQRLNEQELVAKERQDQQTAVQGALHLTRCMLQRLAGDELDQVLLRMLLEDLAHLPASDQARLRAAIDREQGEVAVTTARSLNQAQQQQLQTELPPLLGSEVHCRFVLDPSLLSGLRLSIGDQVLHANLGDELAFFSRSLSLEAP